MQPTLAEALKKSQLFNQYYGPNMESQIGLRGAQSGLIGEQTRSAQMQNQYLPEHLKALSEADNLKAMQDQMFNQMLQQRLAGNQPSNQHVNQPNNPYQEQALPQYNPGEGNVPYRQPEQSSFAQQPTAFPQSQPGNFAQTKSMQEALSQALQQQPTADDLFNKKFFGVDTFSPRHKAYVDSIAKNMQKKQAEDFRVQAEKDLSDFKEVSAAQTDVPVLENTLQSAIRMRDIIQNRPALFGHYLAPGLFAKRATDELAGEFQSKLVPQLAATESKLSQRGNQLALKISESKLPGFADSQQVALGKIDGLIDEIQKRLGVSRAIAGGNIKKIGGKRFKFIDGEWYELEKGEY